MINDNSIQRNPIELLATMLRAIKVQIWWSIAGRDIAWEDSKPRVGCLNDIKCNKFKFGNANTSDLAISGYILLVNILCKNENKLAHQCHHSSQKSAAWNYMFKFFQSLNKTLSKLKCRENKYQVSLEWFVKPTDHQPLNEPSHWDVNDMLGLLEKPFAVRSVGYMLNMSPLLTLIQLPDRTIIIQSEHTLSRLRGNFYDVVMKYMVFKSIKS